MKKALAVAMLAGWMAVGQVARADDKVIVATPRTIDATLTLKTDSVGIVVGYRWGSGELEYQGKKYPFEISGLSIGDLGAARADASGDVYNLKKLEDFNGTYKGAAANLTIVGGGGGNELTNEHGVVIHLARTTVGLKLKVGVDGVKMTLKNPE